ncbi:MAG: hypothetical protein ABJF23_23030 [Bryobacteraceae bacterium]
MRAIFLAFLFTALLSAETQLERGRRVVNEALAALGGEKFRSVCTRVETGRVYSFYRERLTGLSIAKIYTRFDLHADPAKKDALHVRERQSFGKKEDSVVLFLEDAGYQLTYRGAKPVPADTLARYKATTRNNILYFLRERLDEPGLTIESRGSDILSNTPVEMVDITDAENNVIHVAFHHMTKLPVRQVYDRRDPESKERIEEVTLFSKYRDVGGGVQWPFNVLRERNGEKIFEIFAESVTVNDDLDDSLFNLPKNVKVLEK